MIFFNPDSGCGKVRRRVAMRSNCSRRLVKLGRHGMSEVPDHSDGAVTFGRDQIRSWAEEEEG
jgi:hypothetical protein